MAQISGRKLRGTPSEPIVNLGGEFSRLAEEEGTHKAQLARVHAELAVHKEALAGRDEAMRHNNEEHEKAIEEYEQARAIVVELGHRQKQGAACNNLGMSYRALKQYDKAIELLEHSLAIKEEVGDKREQAKTCRNLGVCLSRHGQHDKAVACLKQAWAVYQELGNDVGRAEAALELGQARLSLAQAEHHHAAPDTTSAGGVSAACADTLQEAEAWRRQRGRCRRRSRRSWITAPMPRWRPVLHGYAYAHVAAACTQARLTCCLPFCSQIQASFRGQQTRKQMNRAPVADAAPFGVLLVGAPASGKGGGAGGGAGGEHGQELQGYGARPRLRGGEACGGYCGQGGGQEQVHPQGLPRL